MNFRRPVRKARQREAGQAMVEYALVSVFLFVLFVSILQVILLMYAYSTLADAAKEGIRFAVVHGTGAGASDCSGPGTPKSVSPAVNCKNDSTGSNVVTHVTNFGGLSFQTVGSSEVTVCYDPKSDGSCPTDGSGANGNNPSFGAACSMPGCFVRVTVSHTYTPLFNLKWASFTMNAAADGIIAN